jgi:LCP family protein required for cell wall assembly
MVRRAVTLLLLTLVAPGSAQLAAGNDRLAGIGRTLLRLWGVIVGLAVLVGVLWLISRGIVLAVFTLPTVLALLGVLLIVGGLIWPVLVVDAWRLGQHPSLPLRSRRRLAILAAVLVVVTSVPVVGMGRRVWAAGDLIGSVFGDGASSAAQAGRYNVLLLGGDAGRNRVGLRPDSITLASVDAETGRTVLFSLPRNLENIPFPAGTPANRELPDGWSCGDECLLNALYQWGTEHPKLFPGARDPGAEAMKQAVQAVTGLTVNYYVLIDLSGFSQLIDAVGGVKLTVRQRVPMGGGTSRVFDYIEPGTQRLDGFHALWYARSREGSSDYERMARQRCVMDAMLAQLDPATVLARFQKVAAAGKRVVSTDIPAGELGRFIGLAAKAKGQRVTSVQFVPPLITPARPDLRLLQTKVQRAIEAAERPPAEKTGGSTPGGSSSSGSGSKSTGSTPSGTAGAEAQGDDVRQECSAVAP